MLKSQRTLWSELSKWLVDVVLCASCVIAWICVHCVHFGYSSESIGGWVLKWGTPAKNIANSKGAGENFLSKLGGPVKKNTHCNGARQNLSTFSGGPVKRYCCFKNFSTPAPPTDTFWIVPWYDDYVRKPILWKMVISHCVTSNIHSFDNFRLCLELNLKHEWSHVNSSQNDLEAWF